MRVLALTRYDRMGASSRQRFLQYLPALRDSAIEVEVSALMPNHYLSRLYALRGRSLWTIASSYARRVLVLLNVGGFDLIWIEKELFPGLPAWGERLLSALGVRYVVDFDDAVFHSYDRASGLWGRLLAKKIDVVMRKSTMVVAGSRYLAERAKAAGAQAVRELPTVVDLRRYQECPPPLADVRVIGWIGSPSTVKYLEIIAPSLVQLATEMPLRLHVVGAKFAWPGLTVQCMDWQEDTEVACIQGFDVGVMPLEDSDWERGKCGYKLIQCMACSIPVVASPVGANRDIVQPGLNGFLACSAEDWVKSLRTLLLEPSTRQVFGRAGRRAVEARYALQVAAPRLAGLLREAIVLPQRMR